MKSQRKKDLREIKTSNNKITVEKGPVVIEETCRICRLLKTKEFVEGINYACQ
jgi:hypothetical protein